MEDRWRRAEDELCHRCLSAAAVCLTVGLRIRSIVGSRGECAALTRQCPQASDLPERSEREKRVFVYKSCWDGVGQEERIYSMRKHTNAR